MTQRESNAVDQAIRLFPLRNIDQLFDDLAAVGHRWRSGEDVRVPRMVLHLRSGREMSGTVLDVITDRLGARTVLVLHSPNPQETLSITHVPWSAIEAVTLEDIGSLDLPPDHVPAAPTRQELEARVESVREAIASKVGTPIDIELNLGPDDRLNEPLDWLLKHVEGAVLAIAENDHRAADALRGKVKRIRLGVGMQPVLVFADGVLSVTTPTSWNKRGSRQALQHELMALL